eukprot:SAG11_NODE_2466_length_3324_cov_1.192558_1_plen_37_part_00
MCARNILALFIDGHYHQIRDVWPPKSDVRALGINIK